MDSLTAAPDTPAPALHMPDAPSVELSYDAWEAVCITIAEDYGCERLPVSWSGVGEGFSAFRGLGGRRIFTQLSRVNKFFHSLVKSFLWRGLRVRSTLDAHRLIHQISNPSNATAIQHVHFGKRLDITPRGVSMLNSVSQLVRHLGSLEVLKVGGGVGNGNLLAITPDFFTVLLPNSTSLVCARFTCTYQAPTLAQMLALGASAPNLTHLEISVMSPEPQHGVEKRGRSSPQASSVLFPSLRNLVVGLTPLAPSVGYRWHAQLREFLDILARGGALFNLRNVEFKEDARKHAWSFLRSCCPSLRRLTLPGTRDLARMSHLAVDCPQLIEVRMITNDAFSDNWTWSHHSIATIIIDDARTKPETARILSVSHRAMLREYLQFCVEGNLPGLNTIIINSPSLGPGPERNSVVRLATLGRRRFFERQWRKDAPPLPALVWSWSVFLSSLSWSHWDGC